MENKQTNAADIQGINDNNCMNQNEYTDDV